MLAVPVEIHIPTNVSASPPTAEACHSLLVKYSL
jgi:hypothetical protein